MTADRRREIADRGADPLRETQDAAFRTALADAIGGLPERERLVMSLYYDNELNLKEIGAVLECHRSRVSASCMARLSCD